MYNPSGVGKKGTLFGLPYSLEESDLVFLPVNLDVTVSYRAGTSLAPSLILNESSQLDLSLPSIKDPWKLKMAMHEPIVDKDQNDLYRKKSEAVVQHLEKGKDPLEVATKLAEINTYCEEVVEKVEAHSKKILNKDKFVGIIGGDHSSPLGLLSALSEKYTFGILQMDAHKDLRKAYEGFAHSHASIMCNALPLTGVKSITQVGIRDFCEAEEKFISGFKKNIHTFYNEVLYAKQQEGETWKQQCGKIINTLPKYVYISFDVDVLHPELCPNTGTPVPGGHTFNEAVFLMEELVESGKKIIGFDVCEVGNHAWDANVGSRIVYRLATALGVSNGLLNFK